MKIELPDNIDQILIRRIDAKFILCGIVINLITPNSIFVNLDDKFIRLFIKLYLIPFFFFIFVLTIILDIIQINLITI